MHRKQDFMILIQINDVKYFMGKLLLQDCFDDFLVEEAGVLTFAMLKLQGKRNMEWYDSGQNELEMWVSWKEIKPVVFQYIKGSRTPAMMKISLKAGDVMGNRILENGGVPEIYHRKKPDLFVQIRYENQELFLVTGTAFPEFTMDKTMEQVWDESVKSWLRREKIAFQQRS